MTTPFHPRVLVRAFRYRNYRLFFVGQIVSLTGTWIQMVALQWLVYRLTDSVFMLGLVGFCSQIPSFFVTPLAGVLIDRWNKRRLLLTTQVLFGLQALTLYALYLTGDISVTQILLLSLWTGVVTATDIPARQSFVIDVVERREDLGNAIALNSTLVNGARLAGPVIAGVLIARWGEGVCFLVNAVTYLATLVSLLLMRLPVVKRSAVRLGWLAGLKEGFAYAYGHTPIRALLGLIAVVSLVGLPYMVMLPVYARDIFDAGPHGLGWLASSSGLGALTGAIFLASRQGVRGFGRIIVAATSLFGMGLMAFAFMTALVPALLFMFIAGFGMMVQFAACNTVVQVLVDDDKRGRVMSLYTMAFMGMMPLGSLLTGWIAARVGTPVTLFGQGVICIIAAAVFAAYRPLLRRALMTRVEPGSDLAIDLGLQDAADAIIARDH